MSIQKISDYQIIPPQPNTNSNSLINSIPNELLLKIFSLLSSEDLTSCASVCKSWNSKIKLKALTEYIETLNSDPDKKLESPESQTLNVANSLIELAIKNIADSKTAQVIVQKLETFLKDKDFFARQASPRWLLILILNKANIDKMEPENLEKHNQKLQQSLEILKTEIETLKSKISK